jgi:Mg-chelatase subunit ChlD
MTRSRRDRVNVLLGVLVVAGGALTGALVTAGPASAAGIPCSTTREARQPVLLVHGYNSGPGTWNTATRDELERAGTATCIAVFDYQAYNDRWATNPHLGPALATSIDQLAAASSAGGGAGKVIVVAHSNGGLITRCAAASSCNGGRTDVASHLLEVITFGTPNTGSWLVNRGAKGLGDLLSAACTVSGNYYNDICKGLRTLGTSEATRGFTPGSAQLAALPELPATVPVYALAARVEIHSSFFGLNDTDLGDAGDIIVLEDSATDAARKIGRLGGEQIINCGTIDITDWLRSAHSCWHGSETNDTRFLQAAAHQIGLAEQTSNEPVLFVVDTSLSMDETDYGGQSRIQAAQTTLLDVFEAPENANRRLGLWTFPTTEDACSAGMIRQSPSDPRTDIASVIGSLSAYGNTPTADALRSSVAWLQSQGYTSAIVVLVSDGESNCTGDPCQVAQSLAGSGFKLTVNTAGISLSDEGRNELVCIAESTGGRYVDVVTPADLASAMQNLANNNGSTLISGINVTAVQNNPYVTAVAKVLHTYFKGVNDHSAAEAGRAFTPEARKFGPSDAGIRSSRDDEIAVRALTITSEGAIAAVTFRSRQDARDGPDGRQTCTIWSLNYPLQGNTSKLLIDNKTRNSTYRACSPAEASR